MTQFLRLVCDLSQVNPIELPLLTDLHYIDDLQFAVIGDNNLGLHRIFDDLQQPATVFLNHAH